MPDLAIRADGLGKRYRIGSRAQAFNRLSEQLMHTLSAPARRLRRLGQAPPEEETLWALKDVSFEIECGEVVGVIGRNGAGKSTLLKILSRITEPTEGWVEIHGRVGSLLEVGTGFHPELTGRENIYLNGTILGMKKVEVARKFDEIVAFAEVEPFLDTPVKRYSSGMTVRLAFAVAAHLEPEILLVDEVLAVGDAAFQEKCLGKMGEVASGGRTVLFVSHNMGAVRQLCKTGIVLGGGRVVMAGPAFRCIEIYLQTARSAQGLIRDHVTKNLSAVRLDAVTVNGQSADLVMLGPDQLRLEIEITGWLHQAARVELEARILDQHDIPLAFYSPGHDRGYAELLPAGPLTLRRSILLPLRMNRGEYVLGLYLTDPDVEGWVDIPHAVRLSVEGYRTRTGRAMDYESGAGWLMLAAAPDEEPCERPHAALPDKG